MSPEHIYNYSPACPQSKFIIILQHVPRAHLCNWPNLARVSFSILWPRLQALTVATIHEQSVPLPNFCAVQRISLELWFVGFPKSVPPLVCPADRCDRHRGCPVRPFSTCTICWHTAPSLRHHHTAVSTGCEFLLWRNVPTVETKSHYSLAVVFVTYLCLFVFVSLVWIACVVVVRCCIYYSGTILLSDVEGCACSLCGLWLRAACLGGRARTRKRQK